MRFYKKRHKKVNRYRRANRFEYAIIFNNSNSLVDYVCTLNHKSILNSSLYIKSGHYILLITASTPPHLINNTVLKDRLHLEEIKLNGCLICKDYAIFKIQKAFLKSK